jgi:hypothetical protein
MLTPSYGDGAGFGAGVESSLDLTPGDRYGAHDGAQDGVESSLDLTPVAPTYRGTRATSPTDNRGARPVPAGERRPHLYDRLLYTVYLYVADGVPDDGRDEHARLVAPY